MSVCHIGVYLHFINLIKNANELTNESDYEVLSF